MGSRGKITKWDDNRGFGFITDKATGKQAFVHISAFNNRSRRPGINQVVNYSLAADKNNRPRAENVSRAGDKPDQMGRQRMPLSTLLSLSFLAIILSSVLIGKIPLFFLGLYLIGSLITFLVYARDKSAAQRGGWRTSEGTLHLLSLLGGWPGAIIAQQSLRHKSRKQPFRSVFWITVLLNCGLFVWLLSPKGATMLQSYMGQFNL